MKKLKRSVIVISVIFGVLFSVNVLSSFNKNPQENHFNFKNNFSISNISKSNNYNVLPEENFSCKNWTLTDANIVFILKNSSPIDVSEWHHLYDHLPCQYEATLTQNDRQYGMSLNGGSWGQISTVDTNIFFSFQSDSLESYFLSHLMERRR